MPDEMKSVAWRERVKSLAAERGIPFLDALVALNRGESDDAKS